MPASPMGVGGTSPWSATMKPEANSSSVDGMASGQKELQSEDDPQHVVRIGYTAADFVPPFQGALDDVRIYSRALSAAELRQLAGAKVVASSVTAVACAATSPDITWDLSSENNLRLLIPAGSTPVRLSIAHWQGDSAKQLTSLASQLKPPADMTELTKGGQTRWNEVITTEGKLDEGEGPFLSDEIVLPRDNPWKSWMRIGGFDFFADGQAGRGWHLER